MARFAGPQLLPGSTISSCRRRSTPSRRRIPESGAAIALNSFLPWLRAPDRLPLAGVTGFDNLTFDARCPTGVRGTPPHLDMIAANEENVVAVTARGADYLGRKPWHVLAAAYDSVEVPSQRSGPGSTLLRSLRGKRDDLPRSRCRFGMVKFALGLGRTFPNHRLKLLYLFWEPLDAEASYDVFVHHRRDGASWLTELVAQSGVAFHAQSFDELWSEWEQAIDEPWLRELVAQLRGNATTWPSATTLLYDHPDRGVHRGRRPDLTPGTQPMPEHLGRTTTIARRSVTPASARSRSFMPCRA